MMIDSVVWAQYINSTDTHAHSHVAIANAALTHCVERQNVNTFSWFFTHFSSARHSTQLEEISNIGFLREPVVRLSHDVLHSRIKITFRKR